MTLSIASDVDPLCELYFLPSQVEGEEGNTVALKSVLEATQTEGSIKSVTSVSYIRGSKYNSHKKKVCGRLYPD